MNEPLNYEPPVETLRSAPSRLDVAVIALRLIGLYLLLQCVLLGIMFVPGMFTSFSGSQLTWLELAAPLGFYAGMVGVGICLIVFSEGMGRRLLPRGGGAPSAGAPDGAAWQAIAFAVVGVYLVASTLPQLVTNTLYSIRDETDYMQPQMLSDLLEITLGVLLFLQARGLARFWHKLRSAGTQAEEERSA